jgi:excisionase family DNA binding protein
MALNSIIRLSVSEAARMFGISQRTVRRAITNQEVTYVVVQDRYKINFESLLKWSQETTTVRNKRDKTGLGQFVAQWKIKNKLFSPNPKAIENENGTAKATETTER